jgi:ABC-2 type transport system permease protein
MKQLLSVIKYEYVNAVSSKVFWLTTLGIPVLILFFLFIGYISGQGNDNEVTQLDEDISGDYLVLDKSDSINFEILPDNFKEIEKSDIDDSREKVITDKVNSLFIIPEKIGFDKESKPIEIITQADGVNFFGSNTSVLENLLRINAINKEDISDQTKQIIFSRPNAEVTTLDENGEVEESNIGRFIVPAVMFILFYVVIISAGQTLLLSVAEEKENRMIETLLSIIKTRSLIWGKIISILATTATQIFIWCVSMVLVYIFFNDLAIFNLDLSNISINIFSVSWLLILIFMGIITYGSIMAGVGSLGKNLTDSTRMASVFVFIPIIPMALIGAIIQSPNNIIVQITSYLPIVSPMLLIIRSAFEIRNYEYLLALLLNLIYMFISLWLAVKLFKLGSLENSRSLGVKDILKRFRN